MLYIIIFMNFLKFIIKNPFRRKNSAILSLVGIAIGIIVIVALGGITNGLTNSFENSLHAGGADFSISSKETGDSVFSQINYLVVNVKELQLLEHLQTIHQ